MTPMKLNELLPCAAAVHRGTVLGVDLGSRTSKAILIEGNLVYHALTATGTNASRTALFLIEEVSHAAGIPANRVSQVIGTGYGNVKLELDGIPCQNVTEISCHAKGAFALCPDARTVVDIGGQDSKVISLSAEGEIDDFILNDRCAAGTGRFLEQAAHLLELDIEKFSEGSLKSENPVEMSSQCVVFAESEIVSLKAQGRSPEDIAAGIHRATARRIVSLMRRLPFRERLYFSGGVSNNVGMRQALATETGLAITGGSLDPAFTGALGAALMAGGALLC